MDVTPIFIFSLPRSGSTLLQRMLAAHEEVNTTSEPWFLLPFVYSQREYGVYSEYIHTSSSKAISDIIKQLPQGQSDFFKALRKLALSIYNDLNNNGARYFLDKTPRYYLIVDEISQIFPDAKFIFLFRNPLANLASIIQSFGGGELGDHRHQIDINEGPRLLASGYKTFPHACISIQYEDLVSAPEAMIQSVCDYLELTYDSRMVSSFSEIKLKGNMGDGIGIAKYQAIDREPLTKWMEVLDTRFRIAYAKRFLNSIGDNTIRILGYNPDSLLAELDSIKPRHSFGVMDCFHMLKCICFSFFEIPMMKKKVKCIRKTSKFKQYIHF